MNLSQPFIARPVATTLVTLGIGLAGALAFFLLPIAPLPQVDFPTISVTASLPGASPDTMAATVATPLERALGSIAGVNEMTSSSSLGSTRVTLQFDLDRDIDGAARDVQAAINASRALLPSGLPGNPSYRKVNPADAPMLILALTSTTLSPGQMYDAASTVLAQRLSQVEGVGQVTLGGGALPAVRIELDPNRLAANGIALDNVRTAVTNTNANRPKGSLEDGQRYWQIGANDQARTAADYAPIVLSYRNGAAVRLADVARVTDSVQDVRTYGTANGKPSVLLILNKAPGANIIEAVDRVRALLPQLRASISPAISVDVVVDRTPTIRASLHEVERALAISFGLVIVVVYAFLRSVRAALLPSVAVPVSLAGTFGVMYLLGYSVDNLSLMAMTVATGFVVDDAIVVLENIARHMAQGRSAREAALLGAREIGFTVVSISLSLIAAFIPILFMGGIIGRLFREFAVVLSVAILVSMVVSLTTTPMMAAALLRQRAGGKSHETSRRNGGAVQRAVSRGYRATLRWTLRHQPVALIALAAVIALNVHLYQTIPKGFFPQQDTGRLIGFVQADQSSSFQSMQKKLDAFMAIVQADPAVDTVTGFTGGGQRNTAQMFISLKALAERKASADQIVARLRTQLSHVPGANLFMVPVQDIRIGGRQSNSEYQYTLQADELDELRTWEPRIRRALMQVPELQDVNSDQQDRGLQTSLVIDRDTASRLGVTVANIDNSLNNAFGQRQVGVIYNPLNQYRVVMELAPDYLQSPSALQDFYVTSSSGAQVPLASVVKVSTTNTPLAVNHQSGTPATTISFNLSEGVSLSQATDAVNEAIAGLGVPVSLRGTFQGTAKAFQASLSTQPLLILAAIVTIYLVLGMLYESLIHPITILSTLPSAGVGALLALMLFDTEFSIIALIGVVLLIGIVKKNAIMMIDFAIARQRQARAAGHELAPGPAIYRACRLRLRPILMTTTAAIFGAVPLAAPTLFGSGEGAELRQPLGIAIVGGLLLSQLLTLYTTPVVFVLMDKLRDKLRAGRRRRSQAALAAAAAIGLSGCALHAPAPPVPPPVPVQFKETALWQPAAAGGAASAQTPAPPGSAASAAAEAPPPDDWWTLFNDPVLDDLQRQLVIGNESLKAAVAAMATARAALTASGTAWQPTLSAGLSATRSASPASDFTTTSGGTARADRSVSNSVSLSLDASWELDLWGRLALGTREARAQYQASADDLAAARLSAEATLAQTYLSLRAAEAQLAANQRAVADYEKSLALTQARYRSGVAARSDILQAQTLLKSAQAQVAESQASRAQLEHAIAVLLGQPPAALTLASTARLPDTPTVPEFLPAALIERRPDIAAAERRVAAAYAQIGVTRAAYFPSLSLSASAGYRASALGNLVSAPNVFWSLGPALAQTILDGGARRLASDQALAAADQATSTYRQTVLTALQEVEDNLVLAERLRAEAALQAEALQSARQNVDIVLAQYRAGTVSFLDVSAAQAAAVNSEISLISVRSRELAAVNLLLKNLAGTWSPP